MKKFDPILFELCLRLISKDMGISHLSNTLLESDQNKEKNLKELYLLSLHELNEWSFDEISSAFKNVPDVLKKIDLVSKGEAWLTQVMNNLPPYSPDKYAYLLLKAKKAYESGQMSYEDYAKYRTVLLKVIDRNGDTNLVNQTLNILKQQEPTAIENARRSLNINTLLQSGKSAAVLFSAAVIVATILYISYKIYNNYFSKAAKACAGKKGIDKKECMIDYKLNSLRAQQTVLRKGLAVCSSTTDPNKCKNSIMKRLQKIDFKIRDLSKKSRG
ncbi:MAG: hypothetical protein KatS3mg002_0340 [Candidatus Woesearchaeota archaeon]|nr:MAG: hypothetical protein KatS3mg002_0340 [Candidatus Woesearchaeota archaeon]